VLLPIAPADGDRALGDARRRPGRDRGEPRGSTHPNRRARRERDGGRRTAGGIDARAEPGLRGPRGGLVMRLQSGCIFWRIVAGEIPAAVAAREQEVTAFLDVQPLADGHVLVVPRAHVERVEDLAPPAADALFRAVVRLAGPVREALGAAGTTIGINNGEATGQTIPHVHLHNLPPWDGGGPGRGHSILPRDAQPKPPHLRAA